MVRLDFFTDIKTDCNEYMDITQPMFGLGDSIFAAWCGAEIVGYFVFYAFDCG